MLFVTNGDCVRLFLFNKEIVFVFHCIFPAFDDDVDGIAASPLREQPVPRPNIPSILFVSTKLH